MVWHGGALRRVAVRWGVRALPAPPRAKPQVLPDRFGDKYPAARLGDPQLALRTQLRSALREPSSGT